MTSYFDFYAGSRSRAPSEGLPLQSDSLTTTIRMALDARKIGLSPERTEELMLQAGYGIDVRETPGIAVPHSDDARQADPQSVRQRLFALQDRADGKRHTHSGAL